MLDQTIQPTEPTTHRHQCRHIFTDGRRCGSPSLRGPNGPEDFCYYHHTSRRPVQNLRLRLRRQATFEMPNPEDRSAIQHSIGDILDRLANNELDPRRAGLLLYGLQIASLNLSRLKSPAEPTDASTIVEEFTLDPDFGPIATPAEFHTAQDAPGSAQLAEQEWERLVATDSLPSLDPPVLP